MSTKTMRLPPRRLVTTSSNNKRKNREEEDGTTDAVKSSSTKSPKPEPALDQTRLGSASNQLLAGYLAHEFLTKGTLFGQPWDSAQAESSAPKPCEAEPKCAERLQRYVEVADLISSDGSHFPGVVNPAQLARLLQL